MTWPFENDTSAIVKKLADRSMKADKRRNAFIIITITLMIAESKPEEKEVMVKLVMNLLKL